MEVDALESVSEEEGADEDEVRVAKVLSADGTRGEMRGMRETEG